MSNINIQQFNGGSYQELLPKSQAYNWGYEGQMPQLVKYTDEEFDALLETEWQKMPFASAKQIEWKKEAGRTFFGTLWRYNQESGVLTGITYESLERWYRYRTSNGWGQFYSMAKEDSDYAKIRTAGYTGTGTYRYNAPVSLTFDISPKLVIVMGNSTSSGDGIIFIKGQHQSCPFGNNNSQYGTYVSFNDNTVSWYGTSRAWQINTNGVGYFVIAIA